MHQKKIGLFVAGLILVIGIGSMAGLGKGKRAETGGVEKHEAKVETQKQPEAPTDRVEHVEITPEKTFSELMEEAGMPGSTAMAIYAAAKEDYDLAKIRAGKTIDLVYDPGAANGSPKALIYNIDYEDELRVTKKDGAWVSEKQKIEYDIRIKKTKGTVESSLYAAGLSADMDERAIIGLANVFEWTVDFAQDVRPGDTFSVVYEELWRDGAYVMPGQVLAAEYKNGDKVFRGFLYKDAKGKEGYYDEKGDSLRRMFLKAPLSFKYITSGFTQGQRYVTEFNVSTRHRAIDYAASTGTPIRTTADGVVVYAGWKNLYGNLVSIRHNATYTTNYAHQSKIAVKKGQRVSQGQVIGYVGSTGFSTGPHLHYEMSKNGTLINPLHETFAATEPVSKSEREAFQKTVEKWQGEL